MSDRIPITVHIAPDVLAFLKAEAQRATEQLQHDGHYQPGDDVPLESIASVLLERAVGMLIEHNANNTPAPVMQVDTNQEQLDRGTAARVMELLAEGHVEEAHELAKTIETPSIREEVDPNSQVF